MINGGIHPSSHMDVTGAAIVVIDILSAGGWPESEILAYFEQPQPGRDRVYEEQQVDEYGEVRITAEEMRAEIRRLLIH